MGAKIKLVAADMDGTLLDSEGRLSPEFYPVFDRMCEQNVLFAVASGRQYYNLLKCFEPIKKRMAFIAENGAYVAFKEQALSVVELPKDRIPEFVEKARLIDGAYPILCGEKQAYIENNNPRLLAEAALYFEKRLLVDDLLNVVDDKLLKIAICDFKGAAENSHPHYTSYHDEFQVTVSGKVWLDICNKQANKGNAIKVLQKQFNITPEETMTFGDYMNDLDMIKNAHYGYAMENAVPEVRQAARFIAPSNDQNGVVKVLNEWFL